MWMWEDLELTGNYEFLAAAITNGSLVCVADGFFIKEMHQDICSAAFIMSCSTMRGRLVGKFSEKTLAKEKILAACAYVFPCAYRGELLGLLAILLILLAVNKLNPTLSGSAQIYSDYLGALRNVEHALYPVELPALRYTQKYHDPLHVSILQNSLFSCLGP